MIQISDSAGNIYQEHDIEFVDRKNPEAKRGVYFAWHAFTLPGDYEVILVLYDKATGKRIFGARKLRVEPLGNDPLPGAWSELPPRGVVAWELRTARFIFSSRAPHRRAAG